MESEPRIQLIYNLSIAFQAVGGKAKEVVTPCKTGDDHESCLEKQRSQNLPPWATSLRKRTCSDRIQISCESCPSFESYHFFALYSSGQSIVYYH